MKPSFYSRTSSLLFAFATLTFGGASQAASVTYDADTTTTAAQDGAGAGWLTTNSNFWDGAANVVWPNTSADEAIFGVASGAAASVTVGSVTANKITFNAAGSGNYTLASGIITLAGTTPTIAANVDASISAALAGSAGLTKTGAGTLTLTGANTFSGATTLSAGTVTVAGSSSSPNSTGALLVGGATAKGVLNINTSGTLNLATASGVAIRVGGNAVATNSGAGALNQSAGTVNLGLATTTNYLELGAGGSSYGSCQLSGGTLNIVANDGFRVGASGIGSYVQTNGTLNCGRYLAIGTIGGGLTTGGKGVATFSGGTANISSSFRIIVSDKPSAVATLNIGTLAGGSAIVNNLSGSGVTLLGDAASTSGIVNLNAGTLVLGGPINRNTGNTVGTAAVNFNGGTLRASGNVGLITASTGTLLPVNVFNGGAIIDTQANTANIAANLLATTGNGIYPAGGVIGVASGGSGYIGAPLVAVSGGTGTGATAIASIVGGAITGVTLTSPGKDYVAGDVVTFTFTGGGALSAASPFAYTLTAGDLAANGIGGLTKLGAGTLTLSGTNTYAGPVAVNNGTLALTGANATTAVSLGSATSTGNLAMGQSLSLNSLVTVGLGGSIVGGSSTVSTLTLNQAAGILNLTALGGATGNAGNLSLVRTGAGTFNVAGSTNQLVDATISGGSVQLSSLATQNLTLGNCTVAITNLQAGIPAITAGTSFTASGPVTLKVSGSLTTGIQSVIGYPAGGTIGGAGIGAFTLETSSLPRGTAATLVDDVASHSVALSVSTSNPLAWKGNQGAAWNINSTNNWTMGGFVERYLEGDVTVFDDSASTTNVSLEGNVAPATVTFTHTAKDYTLSGSGAITGTTGLIKNGDGTLTLTNSNTYAGTTAVNAGTLRIGNGTTDGGIAGPITVGAGGTLDFRVSGTPTHAGSITNDGVLTFDTAGTLTLAGSLDGYGNTCVKSGSGRVVFTGGNSYGGTIGITAGTFQIGDGVANGTSSGTYEIAAGAFLRIERATAAAPVWSAITGAGTLALNSAQAVDASAQWGSLTLPAGFTGTLRVEKGRVGFNSGNTSLGGASKVEVLVGAQLLAFSSANPYTAPVDIAGGGWGESGYPDGLRLAASSTATWAGNVTLIADSGIMAQRLSNFTITGAISGPFQCEFYVGDPVGDSGILTVAPTAAAQNSYASTKINGRPSASVVAGNAYAFSSGPLQVAGAILKLNGNSFSFANLSGSVGSIGNYHASSAAGLSVGADGSSTAFSGVISDGGSAPLALVKTGSGILTLTGANSYTGTTTVNQGTLSITVPYLGNASTVTIATGAKLDLATGTAVDTVGKLVLGGVSVPPGTYNALDATFGSYFTGSGSLLVLAPYEAWAALKGLDSSNNGLGQDPDHDGLSNLMEFYLNGNPLASDPAMLPVQTLDATYVTFSFSRRDDAAAAVTSEAAQYGSDLLGWTDVPLGTSSSGPDANGVIVTVTPNGAAPDSIVVQIPRSLAPAGELFVRLKVVK